MKLWMNTKTLDGLIDEITITENKEEADVALLGSKPMDIFEFPNLKGIFRAGVGKDNVPIEEAEKLGVKVCFPSSKTVNYIFEETANFTCYLIMKMLYQNVGTLSPWVKYSRSFLGNRELLLIGQGNIGRMVKEKLSFLLKVKTFDIFENKPDELDKMIKRADCISIHIPNTPENKSFFNAEKLSLMKDGSILINTARGPIVDEDALYEELNKERITAAFDVFWKEPYEGKLKELNPSIFFMTPHVASTCDEFLEGTAKDLKNFIKEIS